ncbi:cob(I)yrinic acid a,c-diamide adenosyltransferase [Kytococcus sedentarius]|uniref:cob(I)yrinic acid a,c-diamide adenosyltransferase n=1 Tax=Kytococcus sedentarius TaxID=1276 RepID=UPI00194F9F18|nr:cob(I)yrinic acid a,c-diamide adenosyltransferase [Kytococcus sedentarius]QRO86678.1 cob(I)yrinic acid a,c-diamide adenosyltransferase [Kytococcus sedentarius]
MVNLTRIYTRTGDDGTTGLGDFGRTSKDDPRLVAYADTDEANAALGVAMLHAGERTDITEVVRRIQNELFDVGADLSLPLRASYEYEPLRVTQEWIDDLEADCDRFNEGLPTLRSFILPGGGELSAHLHVARTVARRAERAAWTAVAVHGTDPAQEGAEKGTGGVSVLPGKYLNRLSDLLFILARSAAGAEGDVLWEPGGGRSQQPERHRGPRQEG